jgi:hypothetical protein
MSRRGSSSTAIVFIGEPAADNLGWFEARNILRSPIAGARVRRRGDGAQPDHRRPFLGLGADHGRYLAVPGSYRLIHVSLWHLLVPGLLLFVGGTLARAQRPAEAAEMSSTDDTLSSCARSR